MGGLQYLLTAPGLLIFAIGIVTTVLSFFVSYNIIMGIKDIELLRGQGLETPRLYSTWKILLAFTIAVHFILLLQIEPLSIVGIIVGFAISVYYLVMFSRTKNLYYAYVPPEAPF